MPYHLSPNGPTLCRAEKGGCPYARAGEPHFAMFADANTAYEERMAAAFGTIEVHKKGLKQRIREKTTYAARDAFVNATAMVLASAPVQNSVKAVRHIREIPNRTKLAVEKKSREAWGSLVAASKVVKSEVAQASAQAAYAALVSREHSRELTEFNAQQAKYRHELALWQSQMNSFYGRERTLSPAKLRSGDTIETAQGRMKVHRIKTNNGTVSVQIRDAKSGKFQKSITFSENTSVKLRRESRNLARGAQDRVSAGYRRAAAKVGSHVELTKKSWGAASSRVRVAANQQREVFDTLFGIDRSVQANRRAPKNAFASVPRLHGRTVIATS